MIDVVAPQWGMKRARARAVSSALGSAAGARMHYEGASRSRRTDGWWAPAGDAAGAQRGALDRLRNVSRDMVRNDPWAARGINVLTHNIVGAGILPSFAGGSKAGRKRVDAVLKAFLGSTQIDADGRHDLSGLQRLIIRALATDGEVLVRRIPQPTSAGLPIPLRLRVLEIDHLDASVDGALTNGNRAVQGVEFDAQGNRVAYHLFGEHPGAMRMHRTGGSQRVPADYVAHVARVDRPGQVRGVPWLAPVMVRLQDLHDFEDAQLLRQKIAACFAAFTIDGENDRAPLVTGAKSDTSVDGLSIDSFEPGMIVNLPGGRDIRFAQPPSVADPTYVSEALRAVAAALGLTFEALTGNLSGVNFSSGRMGWIEMSRGIDEARWITLIPQALAPIGRWVLDAASLVGLPIANVSVDWTPPRREMINPPEEIGAQRDAIRAGLASWSGTVRANGDDPEALFTEIESDKARFDAGNNGKGIILDVDAARVARGVYVNSAPVPEKTPTSPGGPTE